MKSIESGLLPSKYSSL